MSADRPFRALVIGFGRIAAGYARDSRMAQWFPYATHAQVLKEHSAFRWDAVVDPAPAARVEARDSWNISETVAEVGDLADPSSFDIAVLTTPPDTRVGLLDGLPGLKAVMVEKPLGVEINAARAFLDECAARGILVQVNFPRRGDSAMRALVDSLPERVGHARAIFATYGNGLLNNGSHLIDWIRMFLGEIKWVRAISGAPAMAEGPIPGDISIPFVLGLASGSCVMIQPLNFSDYREISLDIWGERGRLSFWHEGLTAAYSPRAEHRFAEDQHEIASDRPQLSVTGQGHALSQLYDNLTDSLSSDAALWSPGGEALRVMVVLEAVKRSHAGFGRREEV